MARGQAGARRPGPRDRDARGADLRATVAESWVRSSAAGVDPEDHLAPVALDRAEIADYRAEHALAAVFPLLYDVLGRAAVDCDAVMAVGDADGKLLWVSGSPEVLRRAERINFVEGSVWAETSAGTNAPGIALHLGAPAIVHGPEHFSRLVHSWTCAAAPIHDPVTRRILGVVDITGGPEIATPQSLAMIHAAARMAESELGRLVAAGRPTLLRTYAAPAPMRVTALGLPEAVVDLPGRSLRLSRRHSELLVALTRHRNGCTADELAVDVYPEGVGGSTLRVELGRLRALVGEEILQSRPYRLAPDLAGDWVSVAAHLAAGRVREALTAYSGPLLPGSEAPAVVEERDTLEAQLRAAILAAGEADLMAIWTRSRSGADDLQMWERLHASLAPTSPLRPVARGQIERLRAAYGLRDRRATSLQHRRP